MNPIKNYRQKKSLGGKATLPPEGGQVALPPSNKGEQEIFRDDKGCNWIQNGIKKKNYIHFPISNDHS